MIIPHWHHDSTMLTPWALSAMTGLTVRLIGSTVILTGTARVEAINIMFRMQNESTPMPHLLAGDIIGSNDVTCALVHVVRVCIT